MEDDPNPVGADEVLVGAIGTFVLLTEMSRLSRLSRLDIPCWFNQ